MKPTFSGKVAVVTGGAGGIGYSIATMSFRTPLGRVGRPEVISFATLFLLADQASFITGIDLVADGGVLAKC